MNKLVLGDCLDFLPSLPARSVHLAVTDPPYGVSFRDRSGRTIANDGELGWLRPVFAQMHRVLRDDSFAVSFYGWTKVDQFMGAWRSAGFRVVGHLVFAKRYASSARFLRYQHECAFLLAKGSPALPADPLPDVLDFQHTGNRLHPTQKPVAPLARLIGAFSRPGDLVLDPFAGSGSTCEAAVVTGRRYLGVELDAAYHRLASERLAALDLAHAA